MEWSLEALMEEEEEAELLHRLEGVLLQLLELFHLLEGVVARGAGVVRHAPAPPVLGADLGRLQRLGGRGGH